MSLSTNGAAVKSSPAYDGWYFSKARKVMRGSQQDVEFKRLHSCKVTWPLRFANLLTGRATLDRTIGGGINAFTLYGVHIRTTQGPCSTNNLPGIAGLYPVLQFPSPIKTDRSQMSDK